MLDRLPVVALAFMPLQWHNVKQLAGPSRAEVGRFLQQENSPGITASGFDRSVVGCLWPARR
jgi:hypothetical protein